MTDVSLLQIERAEKMKRLSRETSAHALSAAQTSKLYQQYLNPVLVSLVKILSTDVRFVSARGIKLQDDKGREYFDFLSGFGSLNLGHEPPEVLTALREAEGLPNILQASLNPYAARLAEYLAALTPGDLTRSFFCSSGTEAVEAALKIARAASGKKVLLSTDGAYHGKTFGALSVSGRKKYKAPFEPLLPGTESIPYNDLFSLEKRLAEGDVAGFIVEPIQGENGVVVPSPGYLQGVESLCRKYETLLLIDEIQTGLGRTGSLFAIDHEGVVPDVLILSKTLGGGVMPIGAIVTTDRVWKKAYGTMETGLLHSTTFGGNTRACACGIASLKTIMDQDLSGNARRIGALLLSGLQQLQQRFPALEEVRGKGLMIGMTFSRFKGSHSLVEGALTLWIARQLVKRFGIITAFTLNNLDVLRIAPPLTAGENEIHYFLKAMEDVLKRAENFRKFGLLSKKV